MAHIDFRNDSTNRDLVLQHHECGDIHIGDVSLTDAISSLTFLSSRSVISKRLRKISCNAFVSATRWCKHVATTRGPR